MMASIPQPEQSILCTGASVITFKALIKLDLFPVPFIVVGFLFTVRRVQFRPCLWRFSWSGPPSLRPTFLLLSSLDHLGLSSPDLSRLQTVKFYFVLGVLLLLFLHGSLFFQAPCMAASTYYLLQIRLTGLPQLHTRISTASHKTSQYPLLYFFTVFSNI